MFLACIPVSPRVTSKNQTQINTHLAISLINFLT